MAKFAANTKVSVPQTIGDVSSGIETPAQAFYAHIVTATGMTIFEKTKSQLPVSRLDNSRPWLINKNGDVDRHAGG